MLQGSQRCIERVPDEGIDTLIGDTGEAEVSREQYPEQPFKNLT